MYQALYRKYRPVDFDSVVGQDAIIKTLKNSIIYHNFSHAYMFFGPRGTGKTTISKIFARNINCTDPKDGVACQKCDCCKAAFSKECVDIIEIDAASNNGVDEIRDLKNKISLVPSELKYKVYIIDEVHMLSIGAFNALLKTLEEPPEHAIFILATTDPQKVPETIISRCQTFSFKRISADVIKKRLEFVCKEEKIKIEDEVLEQIAIFSDGGLRDALGLLDKLTSYSNSKITMDDFTEVNGIISNEQMLNFLTNIMNGNITEVLNDIQLFDNTGKNLIQIVTQLLNFSRNLIVDYYLSNKKVSFSFDKLQKFTNLLNEKMFDIKKSDNTKIFIEMFLLKFINDEVLVSSKTVNVIDEKPYKIIEKTVVEKVDAEVKDKEKVEENNQVVEEDEEEYDFDKEFSDEEEENIPSEPTTNKETLIDKVANDSTDEGPKIVNLEEIIKIRANNTLALANKDLLNKELSNFNLLNDYTFDQEIGYIVCNILDSKIRAVSEENMIISYEYDSNVKQNLLILDKIMDVYKKITNSAKKIAIITDDDWNKLKNDYIAKLKNKEKYTVMDEPEVIFEELEKNDIISNSAVELFGDIVEVE